MFWICSEINENSCMCPTLIYHFLKNIWPLDFTSPPFKSQNRLIVFNIVVIIWSNSYPKNKLLR